MGIVITELRCSNIGDDFHFGRILHQGNEVHAVLVGSYGRLKQLLGDEITAEFDLNEIISVDANLPKDDAQSGIFEWPNSQIVIDGTVHNEVEIDETGSVVDISIQNGADFIAFSSQELKQRPVVGTRIRIVGTGLGVYPTFT